MSPFSSASSMRARATRSLTEPVGLADSSFAQMRTPGLGDSRFSSTSGVLPIAATRSSYRPPQGLFRRSAGVTSRSVVLHPGRCVRYDSGMLRPSAVLIVLAAALAACGGGGGGKEDTRGGGDGAAARAEQA